MSAAPTLTPIPSRRTVGNVQRWSWMFQRASGMILIVLIFTHLFVNLMTGDGVSQIDFGFVVAAIVPMIVVCAPFWNTRSGAGY